MNLLQAAKSTLFLDWSLFVQGDDMTFRGAIGMIEASPDSMKNDLS